MISIKQNPKGIDKPIQQLQQYLYDRLIALWGIDSNSNYKDYECYGRAYKNDSTGGYVAEVFKGGNTNTEEYKEVFLNDNLKAISFFGISDSVDGLEDFRADVFLIFFVNVKKIKQLNHRGDEELRLDVIELCNKRLFGFEMVSYQTGKENVFKEYPGTRRNDGLKAADMHPFHCFRINFKLTYKPNFCNN